MFSFIQPWTEMTSLKPKLALGLVLLAALLGCSRLTLENYGKITVGMHYDEVIKLIGKPDHCDDTMGVRSCDWKDGKSSVHVNFVGDQVLLYSSSDLK